MRKFRAVIIAMAVTLMTACSTIKYVPVDVPRIEKEYIAKVDTTIIRDSVYIKQFSKADTVYLEKYKYKYVTKIQRDTLHRTDTVAVIKEVEVDKPFVPNYYHRVNTGFWVLLTLLLGLTAWKIYKFIRGGWLGRR